GDELDPSDRAATFIVSRTFFQEVRPNGDLPSGSHLQHPRNLDAPAPYDRDNQRVIHTIWPLFALRIRTPRLEIRLPTEDDCAALATVAAAGIHDPAEMPFAVPWTDVSSPELERRAL